VSYGLSLSSIPPDFNDKNKVTAFSSMDDSMAPTYYFLDTEWSDADGRDLVSLALIDESGEHRFYAERAELSPNPTEFVRRCVYPLLDRGALSLSDAAFTTALRAFLRASANPAVMADYPTDLQLLQWALDGCGLPTAQTANCGPKPNLIQTRMWKEGLARRLVEDWFVAHPELSAKRHHALVDAQALRMAWLVSTGRLPAPSWAESYHRLNKS
jgi:hypothetical protein